MTRRGMFRLKYDAAAEAVHEAMPADASETLTLALLMIFAWCRRRLRRRSSSGPI
jgi:hypothetical protein